MFMSTQPCRTLLTRTALLRRGLALACAIVCSMPLWLLPAKSSEGTARAALLQRAPGAAGALLRKLESRLDGALAGTPSAPARASTSARGGSPGTPVGAQARPAGRSVAAWLAGGGNAGRRRGSLSSDLGDLNRCVPCTQPAPRPQPAPR